MRCPQRAVCRSAMTSQLQMDGCVLEGFRREIKVKCGFSLSGTAPSVLLRSCSNRSEYQNINTGLLMRSDMEKKKKFLDNQICDRIQAPK